MISASSRVTCLLHDTAPLFANTVSLSKHVTDLGGYNGLYALNKSLVLCLVIQPKTPMQFLECCEHFAHPLYGCSNMLIHHAVPIIMTEIPIMGLWKLSFPVPWMTHFQGFHSFFSCPNHLLCSSSLPLSQLQFDLHIISYFTLTL